MIAKSTILIIPLLAAFLNCWSQLSETEYQLLISVHDSMIGKYINYELPIVYSGNTSTSSEKLKTKIQNTDTIGKLNGVYIILTKSEKKKIVSHIYKYSDHKWKSNLFPNSKVILKDSIYSFINKLEVEAWSKEAHSLKLRSPVFVFSKPCFIRNESIAFIGFADICGGLCGVVEVSFYGFVDNKWIKLKQISGGVF